MKAPTFSIIVSSFNCEKFIDETIQSVVNQSYADWELLIVDDHSSDRSIEAIKKWVEKDARIILAVRPENRPKGANACRNIGAELAKGTFLIFLDSDDLLAPDCLRQRKSTVDDAPGADMYIFKMAHFLHHPGDIKKNVNKELGVQATNKDYLKMFFSYNLPWPITSTLWRRNFFQLVRFDEQLRRFQDVDVHINALLKNPSLFIELNKEADCYYRNSQFHQQMSHQKREIILNDGIQLLNKYIKDATDHKYPVNEFVFFLIRKYYSAFNFFYRKQIKQIYFHQNATPKERSRIKLLLLFTRKNIAKLPGANRVRNLIINA